MSARLRTRSTSEGTRTPLDTPQARWSRSRTQEADPSGVLRENARQAVELLLEEVSAANGSDSELLAALVSGPSPHGEKTAETRGALAEAEAHEALLQATVRVVMRLVVCLFAESRLLLPVNDPVYASSYGVRTLYELLEESVRAEGGTLGLLNRHTAWPRLVALFHLIHSGPAQRTFSLQPYEGVLFRPGDCHIAESVPRALHLLEHDVRVRDATVYHVLRKLLRQPLAVTRGRAKTVAEAPVDYTNLRTEFLGVIYEGLLTSNARKGTGTYYTRPELAVPTVHRTLEPLCHEMAEDGTLTPRTPETILGLKVCDPACGSASFLIAALHYLTDALSRSLCYHSKLDDLAETKGPLRRRVAERCLHGVDIDPLAVELARVSLWLETMDPDLPFSFLDHKIKVGNSLVGCWLDRELDSPLKAWERKCGDDPDNSAPVRLKAAMDEWCALWFWPTDQETLAHAALPGPFHESGECRTGIVRRLASEWKFFHWELEFPDVFTPERCGFDAVLGNPPWDIMKPLSREFFSAYDPSYLSLDRESAEKNRQQQLFAAIPGLRQRWEAYNASFKAMANWVKSVRTNQAECLSRERPYQFQGNADLNSYKLFLEVGYHLLHSEGRLGFITPSGLYTDSGTRELRELFLDRCSWDWLFSFENRKRIFDIDGRFKFASLIIDRRKSRRPLRTAFMVHNLTDWERPDPPVFSVDPELIRLFSPRSRSVPEVRTERDLAVCRKIYHHSIRLGDNAPGWEISYAREFDMTNDARAGHFKPLEYWKAKGYRPDVFGRWVGPDGDVALPLYEGRMIGQFDFCEKGWVSGKGRKAVWRPLPFDSKELEPQFFVAGGVYANWEKRVPGARFGLMSVGSATNYRTGIGCVLAELPCGNSVSVLSVAGGDLLRTLGVGAAVSSLAFDFVLRARMGGINLNWFIMEECPIPKMGWPRAALDRLVQNAARLTFLHRRFAPEWLRLKHLYPELASREWKHWWAVTEADRLRLRAEIDSLCADLYGLDPEDLDWIVKECRFSVMQLRDRTFTAALDPKGFWRVDREVELRLRLTNVAGAAFRALKAGQWSADSAATMSNNDFFTVIGLPEMVAGSEPLIRQRQGCHCWQPEAFGPGDPRHGWTWEDCEKDASL